MKWFIAIFLTFVSYGITLASPAQTGCLVKDEEEYAVLAAILFRDAPAAVRLEGFEGDSYAIFDETQPGKISQEADRSLSQDFNQKNKQQCTLEAAKLKAHVPDSGKIAFINSAEARKMFSIERGKEERQETIRGRGYVSFSRPGFNKARDQAVVEAHFVADYEMGVGYRVYLEKSKKNAKWVVTQADRTRIY